MSSGNLRSSALSVSSKLDALKISNDETRLFAALANANSLQIGGKQLSVSQLVARMPRGKQPPSATVLIGKKIFHQWSLTLHEYCCNPSKSDKEDRAKLIKALTTKSTGATAVISAFLMSTFSLSPLIAGIIAALLIRLLIVPAGKVLCEAWHDSLKKTSKKKREG